MNDQPSSTEHKAERPPIKVASHSSVTAVAGAIAGVIREVGTADIHAIGAGAVNQAAKALATARLFLEGDGITIAVTMDFLDLTLDDQERTGICFHVWRRET